MFMQVVMQMRTRAEISPAEDTYEPENETFSSEVTAISCHANNFQYLSIAGNVVFSHRNTRRLHKSKHDGNYPAGENYGINSCLSFGKYLLEKPGKTHFFFMKDRQMPLSIPERIDGTLAL